MWICKLLLPEDFLIIILNWLEIKYSRFLFYEDWELWIF